MALLSLFLSVHLAEVTWQLQHHVQCKRVSGSFQRNMHAVFLLKQEDCRSYPLYSAINVETHKIELVANHCFPIKYMITTNPKPIFSQS